MIRSGGYRNSFYQAVRIGASNRDSGAGLGGSAALVADHFGFFAEVVGDGAAAREGRGRGLVVHDEGGGCEGCGGAAIQEVARWQRGEFEEERLLRA